MASVLVTGSSDGIGRAAAAALVAQGHRVVLHARSDARAEQALAAVPGAAGVAVGDLASLADTHALVKRATDLGTYDALVFNAGTARFQAAEPEVTVDGMESVLQVNVLSAYLMTALLPGASRLVYVSSALAGNGVLDLADPHYETRAYDGREAYATTKLMLVMLALGLRRRWPEVASYAFDPGWVRTNMTAANGDSAPLDAAHAGGRLARLTVPGPGFTEPDHFYDTERAWRPSGVAVDEARQDEVLAFCARVTGVPLP